jgi:hypothetical protein
MSWFKHRPRKNPPHEPVPAPQDKPNTIKSV